MNTLLRIKLLLTFILSVSLFGLGFAQQMSDHIIFIKLKSSNANQKNALEISNAVSVILDLSSEDGVLDFNPLQYGLQNTNSSGRVSQQKSKFLEGIQKVILSKDVDVARWVKKVSQYDNVIYAEKMDDMQLLFTPNDKKISSQGYLTRINAFDAWNVTKGSEQRVVAISDAGTDYNHEDLLGKLAFNESDPINGEDDDGNGYIDDYQGWDFANDDNDPQADTPVGSHGTLVAGIVAASTNNNLGIAAVGFKTKYLPIKGFKTENGSAQNLYETIIYAADRGCDVINLSWGSPSTHPSQALQDIINYAVLEKDVVVVAAGGNKNADLTYYPASYDHVLSVGMTDLDDNKQGFSTYNYKIDIMAPGEDIFSIQNNDGYGTGGGTSFAAPMVAATAALVMEVFPDMNAPQVMEQIRMTSDDIYDVGDNQEYYGKLGKGRLNVFRAVSETNTAAIRSFDFQYRGLTGDQIFPGDTVVIDVGFVNILRSVTKAKVALSSPSPYIEILNDQLVLGDLNPLDTIHNFILKFKLKPTTPTSEQIGVRLDYTDAEGYEDFEYFPIFTAPNYLEVDNDLYNLVIGSDGRLGYAADTMLIGAGLNLDTTNIANFMGFMVGTHPDSISDNVINSYEYFSFENDLKSHRAVRFINRPDADVYTQGILSDSSAGNQQGLLIEQEYLSWTDPENNEYYVTEYRLTNTQQKNKYQLKFGLFMDFNLGDSLENFVAWDSTNQLGYTYSLTDPDLMVGVALLTEQSPVFHAIDLFDQSLNPIEITLDFTDQQKYDFMNSEKLIAGGESGYDVAQLVTADVDTLLALSSTKVAYVTVFGSSLADMIAKVEKAKVKYADFLNTPSLNCVVGTCKNEDVILGNADAVAIYSDPLGATLVASGINIDLGNFLSDTTFYYQDSTGGYASDLYQLQVSVVSPKVDFQAIPAELFLGDDPKNEVQFQDLSLGAVSWTWDFDNQSSSILKNPRTAYQVAGIYNIDFSVVSNLGCEESVTKIYEVKERGEAPIVVDQEVCRSTTTTITASNSTSIRIYESETTSAFIFEGAAFTTPSLDTDITYFVSSTASANESTRVPVSIIVDPIKADFFHTPDTLDLTANNLMRISDLSSGASGFSWQVEGEDQGTSSEFVFDYTGLTTVEIIQTATSANGCESIKIENVALLSTDKGGISEQLICKWGSVTAAPLYGDAFIYYADSDRAQILAKGSSALLGPILSDTVFYIANITNYLESELIDFVVKMDDFEINILADPDSLEWGGNPNVNFSLDNADVDDAAWYIGGVLSALDPSPTFTFAGPGTVEMEVVATNILGCNDTTSMTYLTYEMITSVSQGDASSIVLYPNPVGNTLNIGSKLVLDDLKITGMDGRSYDLEIEYSHAGASIVIEGLSQGVYILSGNSEDKPFTIKFVKD